MSSNGSGLAQTASRAFGWSLANTAVSRLGTLVIGVVLARVLGPAEFGTFAVATVALLAVLSFNELGVSLAIVRWREDPATIAPTVTTISTASSAVLCIGMVAAAPAFSAAMGDPSAAPVVQVMAAAVLVNGVVATAAALLQREFRQRERMVADQVNSWLGVFVSLGLALSGSGAMSLAVGRIAGSVVSAVLLLRWAPLPFRFGWDRRCARKLVHFGAPLAGASLVVFASTYTDQLVGGAVLGARTLGFYVLAWNLASWPVSVLSQPLRSVTPALFARLQDDPDRMAGAYRRVLALLAGVAVPICFTLAAVAPTLVELVYGPNWARAAEALRFLAVAAMVRIVVELSYDYLVVLGRSRALLGVQALWAAATVPTLILASRAWGLQGLALGQVLVSTLVALPLYTVALRHGGVSASQVLRILAPPLLLAGGVALVMGRLTSTGRPALAVLVVGGVVGTLVAGVLLARRRSDLALLRRGRSTTPEPTSAS